MEFVIYDTPDIIVNDTKWYLAPFYDNEIKILSEWFTENTDFIIYSEWDDYDQRDDSNILGFDILINSKVFTWLALKFGQPMIDKFTDLVKWDCEHYEFDLTDIYNTINENRFY